MIEQFCAKLINELGATGLLVIGLYFILYKPLTLMSKHLSTINHELSEIITLLRTEIESRKK